MPTRTALLKAMPTVLAAALAVCVGVRAQQKTDGPAAPAPSASPADAAALYEDASKFLERRFAEYERKRVPFSRALEAETRAEQRELAAAHAARLAARGRLKGADRFYLALL